MTKPKAGNPGRGGKREGAGRPEGSKSPLGYGETGAVKAAGLRVPKDAPKEHRELADEALDTIAQVMRGAVHFSEAKPRLAASVYLRSEICGPVAQKHEHTGKDGEPLSISIDLSGPK